MSEGQHRRLEHAGVRLDGEDVTSRSHTRAEVGCSPPALAWAKREEKESKREEEGKDVIMIGRRLLSAARVDGQGDQHRAEKRERRKGGKVDGRKR